MKTLDEIKKMIAMNGGATLTHKGEMLICSHGYMVSLAGCEKITTLDCLNERDIKSYFRLARKNRAYFGLWLDGEQLYLDLSIKVNDKIAARKIGRHNNQLAIFDLSNQKTIYLNALD